MQLNRSKKLKNYLDLVQLVEVGLTLPRSPRMISNGRKVALFFLR